MPVAIRGFDATAFLLAAGLMVVCAGGIGRLLWLLDGSPPLDRPSWWPGSRADKRGAPSPKPHAQSSNRIKAIVACAVCCSAPLLLLAGVVTVGVASVVSVRAAVVVVVAVLVWALTTGRLARSWQRSPRAASAAPPCCADARSSDNAHGRH